MVITHLKKHFFFYSVLLLTVLAVAAVFYRFYILHDYIVYDEVECDPYTDSCYVYCEDDECSEPFYYSTLERRAYNLIEYCNGDNSYDAECDALYECQPDEMECTSTYCDPVIDGDLCEVLTEADMEEPVAEESSDEMGFPIENADVDEMDQIGSSTDNVSSTSANLPEQEE